MPVGTPPAPGHPAAQEQRHQRQLILCNPIAGQARSHASLAWSVGAGLAPRLFGVTHQLPQKSVTYPGGRNIPRGVR
ncbi:hypothetical protein EMIT047CA2_110172 [Pseudomonas soli]